LLLARLHLSYTAPFCRFVSLIFVVRHLPRPPLFPYTTLFRSLVEAGAATKTKAASTGRGRPAWLNRATGSPRTGTSEYLGLASRSEEHTSELQSRFDLVCRPLLEKKTTDRTTCIHKAARRPRT